MKARIYKPSRNTMQSALGKTKLWVLELEPSTARGPEALMGWTASGDTDNQIRLKFPTADAAIAYAEEKGLDYTVSNEHVRIVRPRNYVDNFRYIPPADNATN